jgi:hypothetical protein
MTTPSILPKRALLIGIDYLDSPENRLKGCIDDVVNMREILISQFQYAPNNITTLRDDSADPTLMPTGANMVAQLKRIFENSVHYSEIWIHYSGHGSQTQDANSVNHSGYDEFLVPCDYAMGGTFIFDRDLYALVRLAKCRVFLLFDCCYSGTLCDLQWSFDYQYGNYFARTMNNENVIENQQIYMFSGCKERETSADVFDASANEWVGAFTEAFLLSLKNCNYITNLFRLYHDICVNIKNLGFVQKPMFSSSFANPMFTLSGQGANPSPTPVAPDKAIQLATKPAVLTKPSITTPTAKRNPRKNFANVQPMQNNMVFHMSPNKAAPSIGLTFK